MTDHGKAHDGRTIKLFPSGKHRVVFGHPVFSFYHYVHFLSATIFLSFFLVQVDERIKLRLLLPRQKQQDGFVVEE
jgi:hypothetical protein